MSVRTTASKASSRIRNGWGTMILLVALLIGTIATPTMAQPFAEPAVESGSGWSIIVGTDGSTFFLCNYDNDNPGPTYVLNETISAMSRYFIVNSTTFTEYYYRTITDWGPLKITTALQGPLDATTGEQVNITETYTYQQAGWYNPVSIAFAFFAPNDFGNGTDPLATISVDTSVLIEQDACVASYQTTAPTASQPPSMAPSPEAPTSGARLSWNNHQASFLIGAAALMRMLL